MNELLAKAVVSGVLIAPISEIGKRLPTVAALLASLPPVSVLGMILLWHDVSFWLALALGCLLTVALYLVMARFGPSLSIRL